MGFDEKYIKQLEVDNERLEGVIESLQKEISTLKGIDPNESLKSLEQRLTASQMSCQLMAARIYEVAMNEFEFIDHWKMIAGASFMQRILYNTEHDFVMFFEQRRYPLDFGGMQTVNINIGYVDEWKKENEFFESVKAVTHYLFEESWWRRRKRQYRMGNDLKKGYEMVREVLVRLENLKETPNHFRKMVQESE